MQLLQIVCVGVFLSDIFYIIKQIEYFSPAAHSHTRRFLHLVSQLVAE